MTPSLTADPRAPGRGRLLLGNELWPSSFVLRDHRLEALAHGVTPAEIDLPPGLYEADLHNGQERLRELFEIRPGTTHDARALGMPVDTLVPVRNAVRRRQAAAERVMLLTAGLRDRRAGSGLVIVGPTAAADGRSPRILDDRHLPTGITPDRSAGGWAAPLPPGGWVLRLDRAGPSAGRHVELPFWIARGFQTILFLPGPDDPDLAGLSCHLMPAGSVWTGFDAAAALLEVALERLGAGQRPFGATTAALDFRRLAAVSPMLTLLRALDLHEHPQDGIGAAPLTDHLRRIIPGHPDLAAMTQRPSWPAGVFGTRQEYFPPTTAAGRRLIRRAAARSDLVVPGSLLDFSLRTAVATGPFTVWPVRPGDPLYRTDRPTAHWQPSSPAVPAAMVTAFRVPRVAKLAWALLTGLPGVLRLRRLPDDGWLRGLPRGDGVIVDQAERRLRSYLADLVVAGRVGRARAVLLGFAAPAAAVATGLSRTAAVEAVAAIRRDLARPRPAGPVTPQRLP